MRRVKASAAELPVDLVEEIFLRLDDAADLVRASTACTAFRRIVSDGGFLRRYRSLHRPPVVGLVSSGFHFYPAESPRRSAMAARAVARAAGFSYSFLPKNPYKAEYCWYIHDVRNGRVLLSASRSDLNRATCLSILNLVVYDPLHRNHVQIPPIPNDILGMASCACTTSEQHHCRRYCEFDPFLVPVPAAATEDDDDDLSLQVMCTVLSSRDINVLHTFVYSSVTGKWNRQLASLSYADYEPLHCLRYMNRHYAHGCFYWICYYDEDMLVLDINEMKFSIVRLPPETENEAKVVVEAAAEEDRVVLLVLRENTIHIYRKASGGSANDCWQWRHDDVMITLLDTYNWFFDGAADADQGYALLQGVQRDEYAAWCRSFGKMTPKTNAHFFTIELQTLQVEQLCVTEFDPDEPAAFLYASFPPPFAPPSI